MPQAPAPPPTQLPPSRNIERYYAPVPQTWLPYDPVRPFTPPASVHGSPRILTPRLDARPLQNTITPSTWGPQGSTDSSSSEAVVSSRSTSSDDDDDGCQSFPEINTRQVHRSQWFNNFLDIYSEKPQFQFLVAARGWSASLPLFQVAIEALSMAGLGAEHLSESNKIAVRRRQSLSNRQAVQREGRTAYARALSLLAQEVSKPPIRSQRSRQRLVFMSIQILRYYESFDNAQVNQFDGLIAHNQGSIHYLRACGPALVSEQLETGKWPADWLLFGPLRYQTYLIGLTNRKAILFAEPEWRDVAREAVDSYNNVVESASVVDLVLPLPGYLETADFLWDDSVDDWTTLVEQLLTLQRDLDKWLDDMSVGLEVIDVYQTSFAGALSTSRDPPFRTVLKGHSYFADCWVYRLFATCTLLRAVHVCPEVGVDEADIQRDVYVTATNFARIATTWLDDCPQRSRWYLEFPTRYFETVNMVRELEWCRTLQTIIDERIAVKKHPQLYCHERWGPWHLFASAAAPAIFRFPLEDEPPERRDGLTSYVQWQ